MNWKALNRVMRNPDPPVEVVPPEPASPASTVTPPQPSPSPAPSGDPPGDPPPVVPSVVPDPFDVDADEPPEPDVPPASADPPVVPPKADDPPASDDPPPAPKEGTLEYVQAENQKLRLALLKDNPFYFEDAPPASGDDPPPAPAPAVADPPPVGGDPPPAPVVPPPDAGVIPEYFNEERFEKLLEDRGELNKVMHGIYTSAVEAATRSTSKIISTQLNKVAEAQGAIDTYFRDNPELSEHREQIELTATGVVSKYPGLSFADTLKKAGGIVRKAIRVSAKLPANPGGGGRVGGTPPVTPKLTQIQSEISELDKDD